MTRMVRLLPDLCGTVRPQWDQSQKVLQNKLLSPYAHLCFCNLESLIAVPVEDFFVLSLEFLRVSHLGLALAPIAIFATGSAKENDVR